MTPDADQPGWLSGCFSGCLQLLRCTRSSHPTEAGIPPSAVDETLQTAAVQPLPVRDLWQEASQRAKEKTKSWLQKNLGASNPDPPPPVEQHIRDLRALVTENEEKCNSEAWEITVGHHKIILRDYAASISGFLAQSADVAALFTPPQAVVPWSVVKAIVRIPVTVSEQMGAILGVTETILRIIVRGRLYETVFDADSTQKGSLESALLDLYTASLDLLAESDALFQKGTAGQTIYAILHPGQAKNNVSTLLELEEILSRVVQACQIEHSAAQDAGMRKKLNNLEGQLREINGPLTLMGVAVQEQANKSILDWLTPIDYGPNQSHYFRERQEKTGQWLLRSADFKEWLGTSQKTFFCPGNHGTGKTILTSIVIDDLCNRFRNDNTVGIAYVYCDYRRQHEQTAKDLLASLLKQLSQDKSSLPDSVKSLYDSYGAKNQRQPPFDEISQALQSVAATYSRVLIIVDALDECQATGRCREKLLSEIFDLQSKCGANIFATSRIIPEITKRFERSLRMDIRATDDDVRMYLEGNMPPLPQFVGCSLEDQIKWQGELQEEIKTKIVKAADGMFLLAKLHLKSLEDKNNPKAVRTALEKLATGSEACNYAYGEAMERIQKLGDDQYQLAKRVLSWIPCAKRQLTITELQYGLAVEDGETELNKENLTQPERIVSVCAGLVTVEEESRIIRLVHRTAQFYFDNNWTSWYSDAQREIATACVTYLSFKEFENGPCPSDKDMRSRLENYPFLAYAAQHWGDHVRDVLDASEKVKELVLGFLKESQKLMCFSQVMHLPKYGYLGYTQNSQKQVSRLRVAAAFGLKDIVQLLLEGPDVNEVDNFGWTPLQWAAENGHEEVAKMLLEKGANVDIQDGFGRTALHFAARTGHEAVAKLLIEKWAEVNLQDKFGQLALHLAAEKGDKAVVQLLLNNKSRVNLKSGSGQTALDLAERNKNDAVVELLKKANVNLNDGSGQLGLHEAVKGKKEAVVRHLLEKGTDVNTKDENGQTALHVAAESGNEAIVQLLVENGANVKMKNKYRWNALHIAADNAHVAVVRLLVDNGANINAKNATGGTALHVVARTRRKVWSGNEAMVRLLVERGINIYAKDNEGFVALAGRYASPEKARAVLAEFKPRLEYRTETALHKAAADGNKEETRRLVENGANVNTQDGFGLTALHKASRGGHEVVVQLLMDKGADINMENGDELTALHEAARRGDDRMVQLLVKIGADVNLQNGDGLTALHKAAEEGHEVVVQLLVEKGADIHIKDRLGQTALHFAAKRGHEAAVRLLLENGAVNVEDEYGKTALHKAADNGY